MPDIDVPVIDAQELLYGLLRECLHCYEQFYNNVAVIADHETGVLTREQAEAVFISLSRSHVRH